MRERVNKSTYMLAMGAGLAGAVVFFVLGIVAIVGAAAAQSNGGMSEDAASSAAAAGFFGMFMLAMLCAMLPSIAFLVLLYKAWSAINDGQARTTPGAAVGFMFIPLFNIYWMFMAIYGWAQDYNKYIARHNIRVNPVGEGMFLALPICHLVFWPAALVLIFIVTSQMADGINALADAPQAAVAAAPAR